MQQAVFRRRGNLYLVLKTPRVRSIALSLSLSLSLYSLERLSANVIVLIIAVPHAEGERLKS